MIIAGPHGLGKNLDVMLRPMIDDLKILWHQGVSAYDCFREENFTLRVAILWTISDFPGYSMLSSWSMHGRLSCPICMDSKNAFWLKHGKKFCFFDCHRRFLPPDHAYRKNQMTFKKK